MTLWLFRSPFDPRLGFFFSCIGTVSSQTSFCTIFHLGNGLEVFSCPDVNYILCIFTGHGWPEGGGVLSCQLPPPHHAFLPPPPPNECASVLKNKYKNSHSKKGSNKQMQPGCKLCSVLTNSLPLSRWSCPEAGEKLTKCILQVWLYPPTPHPFPHSRSVGKHVLWHLEKCQMDESLHFAFGCKVMHCSQGAKC